MGSRTITEAVERQNCRSSFGAGSGRSTGRPNSRSSRDGRHSIRFFLVRNCRGRHIRHSLFSCAAISVLETAARVTSRDRRRRGRPLVSRKEAVRSRSRSSSAQLTQDRENTGNTAREWFTARR